MQRFFRILARAIGLGLIAGVVGGAATIVMAWLFGCLTLRTERSLLDLLMIGAVGALGTFLLVVTEYVTQELSKENP